TAPGDARPAVTGSCEPIGRCAACLVASTVARAMRSPPARNRSITGSRSVIAAIVPAAPSLSGRRGEAPLSRPEGHLQRRPVRVIRPLALADEAGRLPRADRDEVVLGR